MFNFRIKFNNLPFQLFRANPLWPHILDHPIVQYIPLSKDPIVTLENYPLVSGSLHNIRVFNEPSDLRPTLNRYELDSEIIRTIDWERELPILSLNLELIDLMYRTNKVVATGSSSPNFLGLFTVNRGYFYRDKIFFSVFDTEGRQISTPTTIFTIDIRK